MEVKYTSIKELVNELYESYNPTSTREEYERRVAVRDELIKRNDEMWNTAKDGCYQKVYCNECLNYECERNPVSEK